MLINKLNEKQKELETNYKQMYKNKELEMQRKYDEMRNQLENKNESNKNKIIHHGIKCNRCFQCPINGYRYKCCECYDYNLCEKCKENNSITEEHPHDFIKMKNEEKKNNPINKIQKTNNVNDKNNLNIFNNNKNEGI